MGKKHELTRQISYCAVAKGAIAIFLPLFALMIGIAVIIYVLHTGPQHIALENKLKHAVEMQKNVIKSEFKIVTSDLLFLSRHIGHENLYPEEGFIYPEQRAELNEEFLLVAETNQLYDQVRLLDENGMEIVRVNFNSGSPAVVPESELQNKKGRYYFDDTFRLDHGEVFVSPFDLNIEHGRIEQPLKPIIRFGTPIFDKRGRKRGIVILNYSGSYLLRKFNDIELSWESKSMLLNSDGYYLNNPTHEDEWGFMYKDRKDHVFGKAYSAAWQRIESDEEGQFETGEGLFTFTTLYPLQAGQISSSGSGKAYSPSGTSLDVKGYKWKIVSHMTAEVLYAENRVFLRWILVILAVLGFILGAGSWRMVCAQVARRYSEGALRESEERYRSLVETIPHGIEEIDTSGTIIFANSAHHKQYEYLENGLIGKNILDLVPTDSERESLRDYLAFLVNEQPPPTPYFGQKRTKKGRVIDVQMAWDYRRDSEGRLIGFTSVITDITERNQAEAQIKTSLKEKEALLGEVYHRVKNNMQLVASLLNLQAENVKEKQYADMFKESRDRVRSMASIHEKLYQSEDLANVDFEGYVKSLSNTLFRAYAADPNKIKLQLEIKDISLGLKTAIPYGLLINELLTNSLKYAFPEGREGEIRISIRPVSEDTVEFIFSDNGVGIPEDLDIKTTDSFGMFLINILAEDQLGGKIELARTGGTKYVIKLKRQE